MGRSFRRIPVFIPQLGCRHACSYCNQAAITGVPQAPPPELIDRIVEQHLATFGTDVREADIAFFGGTFTALPVALQGTYLRQAARYIRNGSPVRSLRFSTRPDDIDPAMLPVYQSYGVRTIELGAQSLHDDILEAVRRGHRRADVEKASADILNAGLRLGLQMMIGLPGDSLERSLDTARRFIALGATETRIYPTLIMEKTLLAEQYRAGLYKPLDLDEAVAWCAEILPLFEAAGGRILRVGLHPSEELVSGDGFLAGPFHPAFRALADSAIWGKIWRKEKFDGTASVEETANRNTTDAAPHPAGTPPQPVRRRERLKLWVPAGQVNSANGHRGENKRYLGTRFRKVSIYGDPTLSGREYRYELCF